MREKGNHTKTISILLIFPILLCGCATSSESSSNESSEIQTLPNSLTNIEEICGEYVETNDLYPLTLNPDYTFTIDVDGEIKQGTYSLTRVNYGESHISYGKVDEDSDNYGSDEEEAYQIVFSKIDGLSDKFSYAFQNEIVHDQFLYYRYSAKTIGGIYCHTYIHSADGTQSVDQYGNTYFGNSFSYYLPTSKPGSGHPALD